MPLFNPIDCPKDLECAICLEPWTDPAELAPCKHVFCKQCVASVSTCPECRKKISGRNLPNRILVNMAAEVRMECSDCHWQGSREQVKGHTTCVPRNSPTPQMASSTAGFGAGVGGYQHQQHPNPAQHANHSGTFHNPATAFSSNHHNAAPAQVIPMAGGGDQPWKQYDLSQLEYDQIFCIFLQFDVDDSGELDKVELKKLARWLNFAHTDHDIQAMFQQMDSDRSGSLSLEEFCTWLKFNRPDPQTLYGMSQTDYNYVLMQFHHYDSDATGELTIHQFTQMVLKSDLARSQEQAQHIFRSVDLDGGGSVDLHEFLMYRGKALATPTASPSNSGVYNAQEAMQNSGSYNPATTSGGYYPNPAAGPPSGSSSYNSNSYNPATGQQQQQQQSQQQQPQVHQNGMYFQQQPQSGSVMPQQQQPASYVAPQPQRPAVWAGPPGWERLMAPNGSPYYIDHNTKTTHWKPPAGSPN